MTAPALHLARRSCASARLQASISASNTRSSAEKRRDDDALFRVDNDVAQHRQGLSLRHAYQ